MNLLLLTGADFENSDTVEISGRRHKHLREILKVKSGDQIRVGLLNNQVGSGEVLDVSASSMKLRVQLKDEPPAPSKIRLIMGLPRPKVLLRTIATAAELGIKTIYFTHSFRVEKSYWSCEQLSEKKIFAACLKGLEQSRDTIVPKIYFKRRFKPFLEDDVPSILENNAAWVAHPYSEKRLPSSLEKPTLLAVGPEGGFIDYEIEKFRDVGFHIGNLGPRILRVETALPMLIGHLSAR